MYHFFFIIERCLLY